MFDKKEKKICYIQYLENYDIPNDKKLKTYDNIKKAVESMHNMTQEILEFSRGEIKLVKAVYPASYIIEEIKNSIKFDIFSEICEWMHRKEHLTREDFKKIVNMALALNPSGRKKFPRAKIKI